MNERLNNLQVHKVYFSVEVGVDQLPLSFITGLEITDGTGGHCRRARRFGRAALQKSTTPTAKLALMPYQVCRRHFLHCAKFTELY